ncbi:MAG: MBL fold metallo-hydrolase [Candidatus Thorarchaeota archaeon]|nr:MBL fold metallo-hydrolase [Candidatus Thorarchaeota archaeon]
MTRIEFLGTRANTDVKTPRHSKHSGVLVDSRILLDVGESEFLENNPEAIFITHLHPDHAFFVNNSVNSIDVPIYAPEESEEIDIEVISEETTVGPFTVTSIPTIHSKIVESTAYLLEDKNRLLYTGDMVWIEKKHHHRFGDLDLVITDGSFIREGGRVFGDNQGNVWGHKGVPDLIDFFKEYTERIIFTHLGKWLLQDVETGKNKMEQFSQVNVELAYDGMVVEIE